MSLSDLFRSHMWQSGAVLFHVGSASVEYALLREKHDGPPEVVYSSKIAFPYQQELNLGRFERAMLSALMDAGLELQNTAAVPPGSGAPLHIKRAYCIFSAPWHVSQTRVVRISKDDDFVVRREQLSDLIQGEKERFEDAVRSMAHAQLGPSPKRIECEVLELALNGYPVSRTAGRRTRELRATLHLSSISGSVVEKTSELLHRLFSNAELSMFSSPLSLFRGLQPIADQRKFLIVEVGGEVTEVTFVMDGVIEASAAFPSGVSSFVRALQNRSGSARSAEAKLKLLSEGKGDEVGGQTAIWQQAIETALDEWRKGFLEACRTAQGGHVIPRTVYVLGDHTWVAPIAKVLEETKSQELTFSTEPFQVDKLDSEMLNRCGSCEGAAACSVRTRIDLCFINSRMKS